MEETGGAKLVSGGLKGIQDALTKLDGGGVLFIDVSGKAMQHGCPGATVHVDAFHLLSGCTY